MKKEISRRTFLNDALTHTMSGFMLLTTPTKPKPQASAQTASFLLGRVFTNKEAIYNDTSFSSGVRYRLQMNNVIAIGDELIGEAINQNNHKWYTVPDYGYIPANSVQLVQQKLNPVQEVGNGGILGIITVPYTKAWKYSPAGKAEGIQLFYYGSTHWISGNYTDEKGDVYYKIYEDRWGDAYYVYASHMHLFSDRELLPISSSVADTEKVIEVNIHDQLVIAYEYGVPVFMSLASTGILLDGKDLSTPPGEYIVNYKRPSRHMVHTDKIGINDSALYGVPWVTYFTDTGIAFHGTYWHSNFGVQRSHGCVNLPIPAAKWIYLWTNPVVPPRQDTFVSRTGTKVIVT